MSFHGTQRSPRSIHFGNGRRAALPQIAKSYGQRVLICSDNRFSVDPLLAAIADDLRRADLQVLVYDRTIAELPLDCILEAADMARDFDPEVVLGIGGGSCLDLAKLVSLVLRHGIELSAFYGEFKIPGPVIPVIAVPTTAGTGSEVTPVAVLADPVRISKVGISSPFLIPEVAVCDPELTASCPKGLTAVAGADALTHALEAFTAISRAPDAGLPLRHVFIGKNALSDAHARNAIEALAANLSVAVHDGSNAVAREQVMYGALAAGLAFGVAGTAAAHAIQYPIGALTKTAHGLGVAALMPFVMEFNRSVAEAQFAEVARLFGIVDGTQQELANAAIDAVAALFADIGIPTNIADLGVPDDQLEWIAEQSLLSARLVNNNPRPLDASSVLEIVRAAHSGDRTLLTKL